MNTDYASWPSRGPRPRELRRRPRPPACARLLEDGILKVFKGISTAEEVASDAQVEGVVD